MGMEREHRGSEASLEWMLLMNFRPYLSTLLVPIVGRAVLLMIVYEEKQHEMKW